jgi:hypothetical protein
MHSQSAQSSEGLYPRADYHGRMALTPGERITLTKRVGEALSGEQAADLFLVLETFGVPDGVRLQGDWASARYEYVLRRLRRASNEVLVGLHAHLYPDVSTEAATTGSVGPWMDGHFRLFLSHTNANKQLAAEIAARLAAFGVDAFVAHDMIEPTKEWMDEIETALGTCDALAALLTEDFVASKWCDQEIGYAVARGILIVAIRQGADPHGFIGKYQAVPGDATPLAAHSIGTRIFETLRTNDMTRAKMPPALVHAYAHSSSYDDARANLGRLKQIPGEHWTDDLVQTAERAGQENSQLYDGVWYGEKIPAVLTSHLDELLDREPSPDTSDFVPVDADDEVPF